MGRTKKQFEDMQEEEANPTKTNYISTEHATMLVTFLKESINEAIVKFTTDTLTLIVENMCASTIAILNQKEESTTKPATNAKRTTKKTQE